MDVKFKNTYRIPSARAQWWDYERTGAYFITICTKNREPFFGEILDGKMNLSALGHFANSCWYEIPKHFPFVELGAFVVMPNHIHGIIIINKPDVNDSPMPQRLVETQNLASPPPSPDPQTVLEIQANGDLDFHVHGGWKNHPNEHCLETQNLASLPPGAGPGSQFGPQSKNLASVVRGYKIGVTKNARLIYADFSWQERYHDHIIRKEAEYLRIAQYIRANPQNWRKDTFHALV